MGIFKNIFSCSVQNDDEDDKTQIAQLELKIEKIQQDILKLFSEVYNIVNKIDILVMNIKLNN